MVGTHQLNAEKLLLLAAQKHPFGAFPGVGERSGVHHLREGEAAAALPRRAAVGQIGVAGERREYQRVRRIECRGMVHWLRSISRWSRRSA